MRKSIILSVAAIFFIALTAFYMQNDPWDIPDKYMSMTNPTSADDDECLEIGEDLYSKHCKSCHGSEGFGDGKKAGEIDTPMPDLTADAYKKHKDGAKYYMSFVGRKDMPNFEKKIPNEEDRWCLISYMETF